jgi:DNA repair protein RecN (Recombination protein N)
LQFEFSPNPGEPLQPLIEIGSGGEISRFLLALKTCFAESDPVDTLIFDEIDTGVSGRVSQAIALQLFQLSRSHQVLCVTHQPIIAAIADRHFHVSKHVYTRN